MKRRRLKRYSFTYSLTAIFLFLLSASLFADTLILKSSPAVSVPESQGDSVVIAIQPMVELDFKTKAEIYQLRTTEVIKYPQLLQGRYAPSEAVFGQIVDDKPWWGILGYCFYGNGPKSIDGPSEESRFIMNPFLLVGMDKEYATRIGAGIVLSNPAYPQPISLVWKKDRQNVTVTYNVTRFWKEAEGYYPAQHMRTFSLDAYNARDLGFDYLYVDEQRSQNITSRNTKNEPLQIPFFIHCGGSCGYVGGCNNGSPTAQDFRIAVKSIPGRVYIKLWHKKPIHKSWKADLVYIINII